ncbi:uncharacterized protein K489DRAFT_384692 [Dissoconium aciculare CBS 342.82]|uniref:C2H2-type domain-containing protein n=1 Tax=Dissoconium aciculare CBS 342.82 TaxID=1314786 RepID=A0A6J3LVY9_9PEZI|nr:uncharacterized protein K489DRAFT_384692 [Dissoconium aciculare CBS 342.82]KAF1818782.1 hypothetical protein K489DRAFT_384692 [Dissoconium aciculare CBS 342.82]
MELFQKYFLHNQAYQVIICKQCQYAVSPAHIQGYLQEKHKSTTVRQRVDIAAFVQRLPHVAQTPDKVKYPDASSPPIAGIPVYPNGHRCVFNVDGRECNVTYRERTGIQKHCKDQHNYQSTRAKGRPDFDAVHRPLWETNQPCQRLFRTGKWQKVFPVQVVPYAGPALEHTGWERHLSNDYRRWITECVKAEPNVDKVQACLEDDAAPFAPESEQALSRACDGTIVLIRRSFQASRVEIVGRHALHCVNRRETGADNNNTPFYGKQKVQTILRHFGLPCSITS